MQFACARKMRSDREEMEKLQQGKTTIKSILKSSKSKENDILALQAQIEVPIKNL